MFVFIYLLVLALFQLRDAHPFESHILVIGKEAIPHAYPYQVGFYANTKYRKDFCGGSLVSKNYVLTSAKCVDSALSVDLIFGAQVIDKNESSQIRIRRSSKEFIIHSGWNKERLINDIALIKLGQPLEENDDVKIIKVTNDVSTYVGEQGTVTGWGRTSHKHSGISSVLRYAISNVLSNDDCKNIDPYARVIQPTHLCLSGSTTRGNVGACIGDTGGPLASNGILIGVTSFVYDDCEAGKPTVFTRLTEFREWIRSNSDVDV